MQVCTIESRILLKNMKNNYLQPWIQRHAIAVWKIAGGEPDHIANGPDGIDEGRENNDADKSQTQLEAGVCVFQDGAAE